MGQSRGQDRIDSRCILGSFASGNDTTGSLVVHPPSRLGKGHPPCHSLHIERDAVQDEIAVLVAEGLDGATLVGQVAGRQGVQSARATEPFPNRKPVAGRFSRLFYTPPRGELVRQANPPLRSTSGHPTAVAVSRGRLARCSIDGGPGASGADHSGRRAPTREAGRKWSGWAASDCRPPRLVGARLPLRYTPTVWHITSLGH